MKYLFIFLIMFLVTSCSGLIKVEVIGVVSDGCAWTTDMYLSEASIKALRDAQKDHPEVRNDREKIVTHNRLYEEFCPKN